MHEASALVVGATSRPPGRSGPGEAEHAVNVAGGLHHAMPGAGSGFCVYNDPAIAIAWLLEQGAERVAYVDVDVHHGDGVERAFWDDPRVLTISLHESGPLPVPRHRVPRRQRRPRRRGPRRQPRAATRARATTRWLRGVPRRGAAAARGVPARGAGDPARLRQPRARPAGPPAASPSTRQRDVVRRAARLRARYAGGRWVATGGGGYELAQVVPRAWTHLLAEAAGSAGPARDARCRRAGGSTSTERYGLAAPLRMTDGATPAWRGLVGGLRPGRRASTAPCWPPGGPCSPPRSRRAARPVSAWPPSRPDRQLRDQLVDARIAGDVAHHPRGQPREVRHARRPRSRRRCSGSSRPGAGTSTTSLDADGREGRGLAGPAATCAAPDRIDPDLTIDGLDRMAEHLGRAGAGPVPRARSPPATRPACSSCTCAAATAPAGCRRDGPHPGRGLRATSRRRRSGKVDRHVRYVGGRRRRQQHAASLNHTHSPEPMRGVLAPRRRTARRPPDLVVADHGWAGPPGRRASPPSGSRTATTRRCSSARPRARSPCPCRWTTTSRRTCYAPMTAYLLHAAGLLS